MKRPAACALFAALLLLFGLPDARAQAKAGLYVGLDSWRYRPLIGASARLDATELVGQEDFPFGIVLNPTLEYRHVWGFDGTLGVRSDQADWSGSVYQFNGNVLFKLRDFGPEDTNVAPYAGAGLMLSRISYSNSVTAFDLDVSDDDSDTTFGLNLLAGADIEVSDAFTPFMQTRLTLSPQTEFELYADNDDIPYSTRFSTRDATSLTVTIGALIGF
ncbi:MAG: hypothetical protein BRD37_06195 [Bacteroidetes bacterium QH_8_67_23]|nr:MAG: hypothetical protein BRD37_06195 [Bacteroidetes bacterium QH_8_67_23]